MLSNLSTEIKIELDNKIELDENYRSSFLHKQANNLRFEEQVCCLILYWNMSSECCINFQRKELDLMWTTFLNTTIY